MKNYNLIVIGGGISGICAAVSAAREGLSVLLVEKTGVLGGAMSNSLVYPFMRHMTDLGKTKINDGLFSEIKERKEKYGDTSWEPYKFVFDDMVQESGVDVLFHSHMYDVIMEDRAMKAVKLSTRAGNITAKADFFIDASGDGNLIASAGCDYQLGREKDGLCQPMTTCFRVGGADVKQFKKDLPYLQETYSRLRDEGKINNPREDILFFCGLGEGIIHFNTTRVVKHNPIDALELSRAEMTARKQIFEMMCFLREHSKAFEKATLLSVAEEIGVRESRKLKGVYVLTADDLRNFVEFEDTIACGNYGIDIHSPDGTGTVQYHLKPGEFYRIPYRSLLPKEYDNMLVAGRCLSATHEAHSAVRIMPICASLGEAAGVAVAVAKNSGTDVHKVDIQTVRAKLLKKGAKL